MALGLTACVPSPPVAQEGDVTETEYRDAFDDYRSCMEDHGYALIGVEQNGVVIEWMYVEEATTTGVEEDCYEPFYPLDSAWQIQNEDTSVAARLYQQCLRRADIAPAETLAEMHEQLLAAGIDPSSCLPG